MISDRNGIRKCECYSYNLMRARKRGKVLSRGIIGGLG